MERVLTVILAGGTGERLQPLTRVRSKPAVPFAGKYRLIDFPLSNCINSGLRQIFVLVQYRSWSLQRHIQEGWGISSSRLGEYIYCVPAQQKIGEEWYQGTADAIRQNLDLLHGKSFEEVLILPGDHVYKMNYQQMVEFHRENNAGLTIAAIRVPRAAAARQLGVFEVDADCRAIGFAEKPEEPKTVPGDEASAMASMGIYIFKVDVLMDILNEKGDDFGKDIIPGLTGRRTDILLYDFTRQNRIEDSLIQVENGRRKKIMVERTRDSSYWRDVGSLDSYYEANMDLIGIDPSFNLYTEKWVFRTFERSLPPSKCIIGGKTLESMVSDGCIISGGTVNFSILSPGVIVEKDALVENSVVLDDVTIEPGARIRHAIVDKEVIIRAGTAVGYDPEADRVRGCTISRKGVVVVPRGMELSPR
ncbi:MAG: glucose-1-phosphate adenylyltransferase [Chloroflexi bacterium RBG_16_60_22]|nr:MAG: glucose-1-phosphate adenylyltransferase [Chloroflexi bacterium RBG_16_60_22]